MYACLPTDPDTPFMPVCGLSCLFELQLLHGAPLLLVPAGGEPRYCSHCLICGQLAQLGNPCILHHATDCPENYWEATTTGGAVIRAIAMLTGKPATTRQIERAAKMAAAKPHLAPELLALHATSDIREDD